MDVRPGNAWRVLRDSLLWREIFSLPQVPAQVLPSLREAVDALIAPEEKALFDWRVDGAFEEIERLLAHSVDRKLTRHPRLGAAREFPNLWKIGVGESGQVNSGYSIPTNGGARNQSAFIFFARQKDSVVALPSPLLREAFCQAVFTQIWGKLKSSRASEIVGKIFERALERACQGKFDRIHSGVK
jgi:hypothetical protein